MSVMDSRECLRHLDSLECPVPVLLLSDNSWEDLEADLQGRVAGIVQKPVGLRTLLTQVRHILKHGARPDTSRLSLTPQPTPAGPRPAPARRRSFRARPG